MKAEKTFTYQNSLPSLPIPPLFDTAEKYLRSVRPLLTEEEYANTQVSTGFLPPQNVPAETTQTPQTHHSLHLDRMSWATITKHSGAHLLTYSSERSC